MARFFLASPGELVAGPRILAYGQALLGSGARVESAQEPVKSEELGARSLAVSRSIYEIEGGSWSGRSILAPSLFGRAPVGRCVGRLAVDKVVSFMRASWTWDAEALVFTVPRGRLLVF